MPHDSNKAVYASIGANVVIATSKFIAAAISGSSAMVAEGVHSMVDVADGSLLLLGRKRSRRPPDALHPFGHGKALYFWSLLVALIFFAVGGGMSLYHGVIELLHPEPLRDPTWSYIVLGVAGVFDGLSFTVAAKQFARTTHGRGWLSTAQASKDPTLYTLVLEDSGDMLGIAIAFAAVFLSHRFGAPWIDAVGSMMIGLLLATIAIFLVRESGKLLMGESADPALVDRIRGVTQDSPAVRGVASVMTMHLGPRNVLAVLEVTFERELSSHDIGDAIARIDERVREACPSVAHLFIEVQSLRNK